MADLWGLSAADLSEGFLAKSFSPVDALEACLARVAKCQPVVNAFVHVDERGAREAAAASAKRWLRGESLGPMDGVPVSLKDNLHARGLPTTWGSRLICWTAPADEAPVARLRAGGAVIFGKTNLPEFALQGITENEVAGVTRNPWNPALTPGGSSGGAAAAVASGCGPLALATDGGGSTRRPASHTGLVGFKPSSGLIPRAGGLPEIFLDHEVPGMIGRTVSDVHALLTTLAEPGTLTPVRAPPRARILFVPSFAQHSVDPGIAQRTREAAARLSGLGHQVKEASAVHWAEEVNELWPAFSAAGLAWMIDRAGQFPEFGLAKGGAADLSLCSSAGRASVALGRAGTAASMFQALGAIRRLERHMDELFSQYDFILTPTTAALPWPVGASHPSEIAGQPAGPRGHAVFTAFANAAGLPAISLPGGFVDGLPTGFQLVGPRGADSAVIDLALHCEQDFPRHDAWPSIPAATMASA